MDDPREQELQQYSGCFEDYDPMSAAEIRDLSIEAGRELTENEAYLFIRRRTHDSAIREMLCETDAEAVRRMSEEMNK